MRMLLTGWLKTIVKTTLLALVAGVVPGEGLHEGERAADRPRVAGGSARVAGVVDRLDPERVAAVGETRRDERTRRRREGTAVEAHQEAGETGARVGRPRR